MSEIKVGDEVLVRGKVMSEEGQDYIELCMYDSRSDTENLFIHKQFCQKIEPSSEKEI